MKNANRRLITRISVLIIFGLISLILEKLFGMHGEFINVIFFLLFIVLLFIEGLGDSIGGTLKALPDSEIKYEYVMKLKFVRVALTWYLFIAMIISLISVVNGVDVYIIFESPIILFLVLAPIFSILIIGEYALEKKKFYGN